MTMWHTVEDRKPCTVFLLLWGEGEAREGRPSLDWTASRDGRKQLEKRATLRLVAEGRRSSPERRHSTVARSRHLVYSTTISQYPWDVTVYCSLMQNGDRPGDRSPILPLKEKTFGNVPQRRPHSRFLTTQLLPYSTSPALFRQSPGVLVIPLETRTLSSSCTTCITSVLDAASRGLLH
jgi:hypothetical protein